jgi:dolichol-phosphate mannosyltransferase
MRRVIVVIPTYNEAENLPLIVPEVLAQDPSVEVLVVDDNSPDGTGKLADEMSASLVRTEPPLEERSNEGPGGEASASRVHVLHRPLKEGLGPAYRAGLDRALELGADIVIQMDADFSHPPSVIPIMLEHIEDHDVVLGSRYLNGITVVNWPIERILISYFGNLYARKVTGLPISDTTGGFRCMRRELLERLEFRRVKSNGYAFQIEMNYRFVDRGARIKEIPFFFLDRTAGTSKLTFRIGLEALWVVWWLRIEDAFGRL